jgi:hypothetical protein
MDKNVGGIDKILRLILAITAVFVGTFAPIAGGFRIIAFVVAAVALFTGIYGF